MNTKEQKLNNYFIWILWPTSELSTCYRVKVWAIIVQNWRIISSWYNWTPSWILECEEYKQIISPLFAKIWKWEINDQNNIIEYIIQWIHNMKKWYENNEELLNFIKEENEKYFTKHYIDTLVFDYNNDKNIQNWRKDLRKEFLLRNNIFHSDNSILWEVHAEQNVLLYASKAWISVDWCDLYCNYLPCPTCSKLIKQAWIKRVFYIMEYSKNWTKSSQFFKLNWIELKKIKFIENL